MTDSVQQVWVIPENPADMAPLPALQRGDKFSFWDRHKKQFGPWEDGVFFDLFQPSYATFEECRAAMIAARTSELEQFRRHSRNLAASIEHVRTIPAADFPNVSREVPEAQQQEAEGQEKAQQQEAEVRPAVKPTLRQRPSRR